MVTNPDGSLVYFDEGPVLFTKETSPAARPTQTPTSRTDDMENVLVAEWGTDNNFPENARLAKESNPDLINALEWKARALYAGGIDYVIRDRATLQDITNDKTLRDMTWELDQFKFRNRQYLHQACLDFYDLANVFPQIILSEDRSRIDRIVALNAQDCRFKRRDKFGRFTQLYIHPAWEEWSNSTKDEKLRIVDIIDPLLADPTEIKSKQGSTLKYVYPIAMPSGKSYYQYPAWWSAKVSEWLDFVSLIPTAKTAIIRNMAKIQYHIQMPDTWMADRYSNWNKMTDEEKRQATIKEFKIINDVLHNPKNHGKSIYTTFKIQQAQAKEYGSWKIEAVDDKMKDGALLADSSEGTTKILSANGVDPSLTGLIPGTQGSRSGSDKREALNIYMSLIRCHQDKIMEPWNFASWYNGWNTPDIEVIWYIVTPLLQTLNTVSPDNRQTLIPTPDANQL
jgi:hypothetical protein